MTTPILKGLNWTLPFHIHMDALDREIRVAMRQFKGKIPHEKYFINKNLSKDELNYTITEKEFIVVVHSLKKNRHYISGYQVIMHTDHDKIKYLMINDM